MAIAITADFATIGTTEYFLASDSTTATYQTDDLVLQCFIEFNNMAAGDEYKVKLYTKVNAGTATPVYEWTLQGSQSAIFATPAVVVGEGWEVSVTKVSGTDRSIAWSLRKVT